MNCFYKESKSIKINIFFLRGGVRLEEGTRVSDFFLQRI